MQIYNSATHRKEEFVPREPHKVAMYACGPTVYNHIHIGNARTFLTFDVVRKYLAFRGYDVTFVQNITDVDDKIINRAHEEGKTPEEIAAFYTDAFIETMHRFRVDDPDVRPRATQEIPEMIELVQLLIDRGHAYESQGDVYFSVRSFKNYGELSNRNVDELESGARVDVNDLKRDPLDFALWKAAKPGEPHWSSPWGEGRPGWHLECSAMSQKYLGLPLDIHGGGNDLAFPHHENEKAQTEAAYGERFVNFWMHSGMLNIHNEETGEDEKMSKSLGNFLLLKDVLDTCDADALRLLMLQTHYRSPLNFGDERLKEAAASLERISTVVRNLRWSAQNAAPSEGIDVSACVSAREKMRADFIEAMDDDFNSAGALAAIFTFVSFCNRFLEENKAMGDAAREAALANAEAIEELLGVLGISLAHEETIENADEVCALAKELAGYEGEDAQEAVEALLASRQEARSAKDWARADAVRDGLAGLGFTIEDTPNGARVVYGK